MDLSLYFTGPKLGTCAAQLKALGLEGVRPVRYTGYTDFIPWSTPQRFLDFKVGIGSWMLSHRHALVHYDYVNIVDPIYRFCFQTACWVRPSQKLIMVRWENQYGRYDRIWMASRYALRVFKRVDVIFCVTKASLYSLQIPSNCSAEVVQIYPGIDLRGVRPDESIRARNDPPVVLFVGRLQWTKGLQVLLAAVSILRKHFKLVVRLKVVGEGQASSFKHLTETLELQDLVEFVGAVSNAKVRQLMQTADLFCFPSLVSPSWMEQFGFALVEAMAHALPVVAFDSGSVREICGDDGVYASTGNAFALAEVLAMVLRDESMAKVRGRRLQLRAFQEFDADCQGDKMLKVLKVL